MNIDDVHTVEGTKTPSNKWVTNCPNIINAANHICNQPLYFSTAQSSKHTRKTCHRCRIGYVVRVTDFSDDTSTIMLRCTRPGKFVVENGSGGTTTTNDAGDKPRTTEEIEAAIRVMAKEIDDIRRDATVDPHLVAQNVTAEVEPKIISIVNRVAKQLAEDLRPRDDVKLVSPIAVKKNLKKVPLSQRHVAYEEVMDCLAAEGKVYMVGPPGSGKSSLARQIADDIGKSFGYLPCTEGLSEAHILGRMNASGDYIPSQFVTIFEKGGIFLFDEIDAADANTLLVIQEALSNGHVSVPNRPKKPEAVKHTDTLIICAANTYGTGTSAEFSGRNQLDAATLDRFVGLNVTVDYDIERERGIAKSCGTMPLMEALWAIRKNVLDGRVKRPVSTRAIIQLSSLHKRNPKRYTFGALVDRFFRGWSDTERKKAEQGINFGRLFRVDGSDEDGEERDDDASAQSGPISNPNAPECPKCNKKMRRRVATRGPRRGKPFWGCQQFPDCRSIVPING